jgi:dihydrofolate reductase
VQAPRSEDDRENLYTDEYELVVHPVILGGGTPFFPDLERPAGLRLLETRTFSSGVVYLGFAAR